MFRIDMLPARQGDALWIEYGDDPARPHRVLVDAGVRATSAAVAARLRALPATERALELFVVTHIDGDHILGALPLLADAELGASYADVWFNGWRHLPAAVGTRGAPDGEELTWLLERGPAWNAAFAGGPVMVPRRGPLPRITLPGGLALTVVGPGKDDLVRLRPTWEEEVRDAGLVPGEGRPPARAVPPVPAGLTRAGPPDVAALAATEFVEDDSAPNGSSIVLLAEYAGCAALLCGDAWPSVVRRGVGRLLRHRGERRLALSAFKLPHHGSGYNLDRALLRKLDCREFLVSSDGTRTSHPHPEAIARVIDVCDAPRLWFNYRTRFTEVWDDPGLRERHGHTAVYGDGTVSIELEPVAG